MCLGDLIDTVIRLVMPLANVIHSFVTEGFTEPKRSQKDCCFHFIVPMVASLFHQFRTLVWSLQLCYNHLQAVA